MGSCFAQRIGQRLSDARFRTQVNPMGIVFNPVSLARLLTSAASPGQESELIHHLEQWHSLDYHSNFSDPNPEVVTESIEMAQMLTGRHLEQADVLILTLGTAYAYRWKETWEVVNNCHKLPANQFEKCLLGVEECTKALEQAISQWRQRNPKLRVLLTVSPVRHIKDGIAENNLSKSILRLVCHNLAQANPEVAYFPAFEILNDDLRDYRFYQDDLIHPTTFAEDYIWEKFAKAAFTPETEHLLTLWQSAQQALAHQPFSPHFAGYRSHLEGLLHKLEQLNLLLDCTEELEEVRSRIRAIEMGEYRA